MAIPRKGSRRIVVDGRPFRWTIRKKPSYGQALAESPLTVAAEAEGENGAVLLASFNQSRPDNWQVPSDLQVTPAAVAECIRRAIGDGWDPNEPGGAFEFAYVVDAPANQ